MATWAGDSCQIGAKANILLPSNPTPTHTLSLDYLCSVKMKHDQSPGMKGKPPRLRRAASVGCRRGAVVNISYGLVAKPFNFKNE